MANERFAQFTEETPKSYVQGLFEESVSQKHRLGTLRELSDGKQYIYGKVGAANIAAGYLCCGPTEEAANKSDLAVTANANVGERAVAITIGDLAANVTANQFAEGWLYEDLANAANSCAYKIKSNPAFVANASGTIQLYDKIRSDITTSFTVSLAAHQCSGVIIHPSPNLNVLVGVSTMPMTTLYYGWFQKRGPAPITAVGTLVVGETCVPSTVDGSVTIGANGTSEILQQVGTVMVPNANDCFALIDLKL